MIHIRDELIYAVNSGDAEELAIKTGIENAPQIRDALFNTDEFPMKEKSQGTQPIKYS